MSKKIMFNNIHTRTEKQQRCCFSDNDDFITISSRVTNHFSARQYTKHIIESANENFHSIHREDILRPSEKKVSRNRIPFYSISISFHPTICPLGRIITKHCKTLITDQDIKDNFILLPITSHKRYLST